jgi:hypothetical protein
MEKRYYMRAYEGIVDFVTPCSMQNAEDAVDGISESRRRNAENLAIC